MKVNRPRPLIAKPNAGSPELIAGVEKYLAGPDQFADHVKEWVEARARIVSACCGYCPAHL